MRISYWSSDVCTSELMLIGKRQASDDVEFLEAYTRELAGVEEVIPLGEGLAGIAAFEIIGGIEQVLAACLALAARERAQRVETAPDRADNTAFTLAVGRDRADPRRHRLVVAVGQPEAPARDLGAASGFAHEWVPPLSRGRAAHDGREGPPP